MSSAYSVETNLITLTRHSIHDQGKFEQAKGDFTLLLTSIQLGCKFVANAVRKAGLANLYSFTLFVCLFVCLFVLSCHLLSLTNHD